MPHVASKKQYRYIMAILHGRKGGTSARGDRIPKSVAEKYEGSGEGEPESKGKEHSGGKWTDAHHKKHSEKVKKAQDNSVAGIIVRNRAGSILMGRRTDTNQWTIPGGKVEAGESHEEGAIREVLEETGIKCKHVVHFKDQNIRSLDGKVFICTSYEGSPQSTDELTGVGFVSPCDLKWADMTDYTRDALTDLVRAEAQHDRVLTTMIADDILEKNIIRRNGQTDVTYEATHGDALRTVGTGTFRFLRESVRGMECEDFRDIHIDNYVLKIRKHVNDVYSGRIEDGHKIIHQFTNKSLPAVAAELMSVFEWYLPEDEPVFGMISDDEFAETLVEGGLNGLAEEYRRHNLANIYDEMENIRREIRQGNAVDVQQVELRIMKLFDKIESKMLNSNDKHNLLVREVGEAVDQIEFKLRELQEAVDSIQKQPTKVEAYSSNPASPQRVHDEFYPYLSKPTVEIDPSGRIRIMFNPDWSPMEKENFLHDMRAKIVKKKKT